MDKDEHGTTGGQSAGEAFGTTAYLTHTGRRRQQGTGRRPTATNTDAVHETETGNCATEADRNRKEAANTAHTAARRG
jgi:hypothetical protein